MIDYKNVDTDLVYVKKTELFPEEKRMPAAKYFYDYPLHKMGPLQRQVIDQCSPMDPKDAIQPENFLDLLRPTGYDKVEMGYCMFPDGSGYVATYRVTPPTVTQDMLKWYRHWMNIHSKSMVQGHGNLRYKLWNPADHWDHYFINWTEPSDGIYTTESLDMGEGERKYDTIRHDFDLADFGMTEERFQELEDAGCPIRRNSSWESFDHPGAHLTLSITRPCPFGGYETRSREWIGWRPHKGKLLREERTECSEAYLRKVIIHTVTEWEHLFTFLPDLHAEYKDKPVEED